MWWFSKFMCELFNLLLNAPEKSMSTCAGEAYAEKLGPHHGFFIRQGAKLAMSAAGSRE